LPECSVIDAVREALREEMRRDPTVFIMGEDVGQRGGVFLATQGFLEEFGRSRVIDTPLAEASIMGIALGAAFRGLRPISEMQFSDFIWPRPGFPMGQTALSESPWSSECPTAGALEGACSIPRM